MKTIETNSFLKLSKSKYPKSETEPYNPWAVCNKSTDGKKEDPEKFERCVQHLRDQNRKKNKKSEDEWLNVIEAKEKEKWIPKDMDEGSFTEYCGGKVTEECIQRGKNSPDKKTRQRANLADTFRNMSKKKKK